MSAPRPRFVADESCDFTAVRALRAAGFDVFSIPESAPRMTDREVIALSFRESRILVTEDQDFGWLVHVSSAQSAGVILLRFPARARSRLGADVVRFVAEHGMEVRQRFVVIEPGLVRYHPQEH